MTLEPLLFFSICAAGNHRTIDSVLPLTPKLAMTPVCCTRLSSCKRPSWVPAPRGLAVLLGGFIIHFSLGTLYTHGNLSSYIISYVRNYSHPRDLSGGTTGWLYGAALMGQGVSMFAGGLLEMKIGPRYTALLGSFVMSAGVMLSAVAIKYSFWLLLVTYGALFGVGSGIAYIAPLVCAMKWLPRWKGAANGVVVSGFGLGAFVFDLAQTRYLNPSNLQAAMDVVTEDSFFTDAGVLSRVPISFLIFGGVYMTMQLVGCALLTNPTPHKRRHDQEGTKERHGTTSSVGTQSLASDISSSGNPESSLLSAAGAGVAGTPVPAGGPAARSVEMEEFPLPAKDNETGGWTTNVISSVSPLKMLKTLNFYHLWAVLVLNGITLACIITMYKMFGQTVISNDLFLAVTGSVASAFNFVGRLFWGFFADVFTFKLATVCLLAITTVLTLTFYAITLGTHAVFFIWVCAFFFCVGGTYVLFPTAIARSYGPKYIGVNYGLLFTAQVVAGVVSSVLSDSPIDWSPFFFAVSAISVLSFLLMMCFRNKRYMLQAP